MNINKYEHAIENKLSIYFNFKEMFSRLYVRYLPLTIVLHNYKAIKVIVLDSKPSQQIRFYFLVSAY